MSRYYLGSRRDSLASEFDRHSEVGSLHEAKLAAWALANGDRAAGGYRAGRRRHRGMLPDLPLPEPPPAYPMGAGVLARLAGFARGLFTRPAMPAPGAVAELADHAGSDRATIIHLGRKNGAGAAAAEPAPASEPIRPRAA